MVLAGARTGHRRRRRAVAVTSCAACRRSVNDEAPPDVEPM